MPVRRRGLKLSVKDKVGKMPGMFSKWRVSSFTGVCKGCVFVWSGVCDGKESQFQRQTNASLQRVLNVMLRRLDIIQ